MTLVVGLIYWKKVRPVSNDDASFFFFAMLMSERLDEESGPCTGRHRGLV